MTRVEFRISASLLIAIAAGGVWFLMAKHRLEVEITAARATPAEGIELANLAEPPPANSLASESAHGGRETVFSAAPSPSTAISPRVRELGSVIANGMMGRMNWKSPPNNDLFATFETVAGVLDLSAAETNALLDEVESSNQAVVQGILSATTVTRPSPDQVMMAIRDSSEAQIAAIRMQDSVREILGEERYRIYEDLGIKALVDDTFGKMGLGATTLTFSKERDGRPPDPSYLVSEQLPGDGGNINVTGGGDRTSLRADHWPLSELLPEDF